MVQFISVVGAAALLSSSALAAPAMRRSQYYQQEQHVPQPAKGHETVVYEAAPTHAPAKNVYENVHDTVAPVQQHETTTYEWDYESVAPVEQHETTTAEWVYEPEEVVYESEVLEHDTTQAWEYDTTTAAAVHETPVWQETAPVYEYVPEHVSEEAVWAETTTAAAEEAWPTYGSGSQQWGASYDDCVSQCVAKYGAPTASYVPVAHPVPTATGAVHTVMVAPEAGVLRYWPFAINATVGDTVRYVWTTPANHTATLSSELSICNRSALAEGRSFVSGIKNGAEGEQVFDVVVQTEEPQFFYCSVAQHCEKGMWGIINPKTQFGGINTVGAKMREWTEANPDLKAAWGVIHETTQGTAADSWGNNFSLDTIPEAAYEDVAANVMWTRAMFGANPGSLEAGKGASTPDGSPISIVGDLQTLLSGANLDPVAADVPRGTPTGAVPVASEIAEELNSAASHNAVAFWFAALVGVASWMLF